MPKVMKRSRHSLEIRRCASFLLAAILSSFASVLLFHSTCFGEAGFDPSDLSKILKDEWRAYKSDKPGFPGGLAIQILSPQGTYFAATDMDKNISEDYHFRIASVTKTFTAAAIMLLHQRGALDIDAKITDKIPGKGTPYVPDTPGYDLPYKKDMTISMLLMHRAGVFDITNNDIPDNEFSRKEKYAGRSYLDFMEEKDGGHTFTFDELIGVVARNRLSFFEPGTSYHYSDTGYSILGKIIERVSGKSYSDFVRDELLIPNGLLSTSAPSKGTDQTIPAPFAKGYVWADAEHVEDVTESNMSPHVAEGNIISTPADLAQWCKKLFAGQAGLTPQTVEMMKAGMSTGDGTEYQYGLGISYMPNAGYGHAGAHEGYLTLMYYDPGTDIAYAMFANNWNLEEGLTSIKDEITLMMGIAHKIFQKMGYGN
jgi:D-alanyl-D-alanine carboxypeptidase